MMHTSQLHDFGRGSQASWEDLGFDAIGLVETLSLYAEFLGFVVIDEPMWNQPAVTSQLCERMHTRLQNALSTR